jgi:chemotaxis protein MotB
VRQGSDKYQQRGRYQYRDDQAKASHERWLVSYADFMTLLMAFFVVMYSISQISEHKYRVLSATFSKAFSSPTEYSTMPDEGLPLLSYTKTPLDLEGRAAEDRPGNDANEIPAQFVSITEQLEERFESLIDSELVSVAGDERWLEIELQSGVLFGSGGATLGKPAAAIISAISETLLPHTNVIRVEGFTDDVPIATNTFASNWELSTARAAAVVKQLVAEGIAPERLAAVGYGEHQPVVHNDSDEHRARNRRIVLMVSTKEQHRPKLEPKAQIIVQPQLTRYQQRKPLAEGELVYGLDDSARAQAEAWLARNVPVAAVEEPAQTEPLSATTITNSIEKALASPVQTPANEPLLQVERQTAQSAASAKGVKQVELDSGALLFTSE